MRLAQHDMGAEDAVTYLVDGIMPEAGCGSPEVPGGWTDEDSPLAMHFRDVVILNCLTLEAARGFFRKNRVTIDYLHIDADHSLEAVLGDWQAYLPLLAREAVVSLHDTGKPAVERALNAIREDHPEFQCLDLPDVGAGLAILRRRIAPG
jgi:hypothetical protein